MAQNKVTLSGKVKDQHGTPVAQATIAVENTTSGTYTDARGQYSLQVAPGKHTVVVSFLGYQTVKPVSYTHLLHAQHRIGIRQFCFLTAGVPDAGDDKRTVQQWFHISDPLDVYCLIAYLYRYGTHGQLLQMTQPVLGLLLFFLGINPHENLQGYQLSLIHIYSSDLTSCDAPAVGYATVYPLAMFLRVLTAQLLILALA